MAFVLLNGCASERVTPGQTSALYRQLEAASLKVIVNGRLAGSGFFIESEEAGRAVTAAHVLWPEESCEVVTADGRRLDARVVGWDRGHDAALLQVDDVGEHAALPLAEAMPPPGERVFLFGMPVFRHNVMMTGRVARAEPTYEYYGDSSVAVGCYHVAAAAASGFSGGPWVDGRGRVVGVQSGGMRSQGSAAGIAFVSDLEALRQLASTGAHGHGPTLRMAVEEMWEQPSDFVARHSDHPQALVAKQTQENGPAHEAGVSDKTLILAIDGEQVASRDAFYDALRRHAAGDGLTLTILAEDEEEPRTIEVTAESLDRSSSSE